MGVCLMWTQPQSTGWCVVQQDDVEVCTYAAAARCIPAVCQSLRILSFSSTQLPGPALHCHGDQPTATIEPVSAWWQYLIVDVGRQAAHSCGDLIFSSHMTFILTGRVPGLAYRL